MPRKNAVSDWYTFDVGNIVLHVMTDKCRAKYALDILHGVGWRPEERELEEVDSEL
jgi:ribosomal silencing factor RsfS